MDAALFNAKKRLGAIRIQIQKLKDEETKVLSFIEMYGQFSGTDQEDRDGGKASSRGLVRKLIELAKEPELAARERGRPAEFTRYMQAVLKDAQRPLLRGEIVDELEKRDYIIPSDDKPRYVGTILWRYQSKFVNLAKKGYWLRNEPCPAVNYWPEAGGHHRDAPEDAEPDLGEADRD